MTKLVFDTYLVRLCFIDHIENVQKNKKKTNPISENYQKEFELFC